MNALYSLPSVSVAELKKPLVFALLYTVVSVCAGVSKPYVDPLCCAVIGIGYFTFALFLSFAELEIFCALYSGLSILIPEDSGKLLV